MNGPKLPHHRRGPGFSHLLGGLLQVVPKVITVGARGGGKADILCWLGGIIVLRRYK